MLNFKMDSVFKGLLTAMLFCLAFKWSHCQANQFGTPRGCLLNRLDVVRCVFRNPLATAVPEDNQYGIYKTRILRVGSKRICFIRRRNHVVRRIDTAGGDPRLLLLFSPGRTLAIPENYGNQYYVKYRITCPPDHFSFFDLTSIEMEEPNCIDPNFDKPRCVDYIQISTRGGQFGFTENCGTEIRPENTMRIDSGQITMIFRSSDSRRFAGFQAAVICVKLEQDNNENGRRRRKRITEFNGLVERHRGYVRRMRRATGSISGSLCLAEIDVHVGTGLMYVNRVATIVDLSSMHEIRRLPAPINRLTTLDISGEQNVFFREAFTESTNSPTIFSGPGPLTITGSFIFFTTFAEIPELGGIQPEALMPSPEETSVLRQLLPAHFKQILERDSEALPKQDLNTPPFDLEKLGIYDTSTSAAGYSWKQNTLVSPRRSKRAAQELLPTPCNLTDSILATAILYQQTENPILAAVIHVLMDCTEFAQPGRIEELIESIELEFQFCQDSYSVSEGDGSISVCVESFTNGSLPRNVELNVFTQDQSAIESADYNPVNVSLFFANGTLQGGNGSQVCFEVQLVDNGVLELTESLILMAQSPDPNVDSSSITTTVFIVDDEPLTFEFFQLVTFEEDIGTITLPINLTEGMLPFDVNVTLEIITELDLNVALAIAGLDYRLSDSVVTFPAGSSSPIQKFAEITIVDDTFVEAPCEFIVIQASSPAGQFSTRQQLIPELSVNRAVAAIIDNDRVVCHCANTVASYTCNKSFTLVGNPTRTCGDGSIIYCWCI